MKLIIEDKEHPFSLDDIENIIIKQAKKSNIWFIKVKNIDTEIKLNLYGRAKRTYSINLDVSCLECGTFLNTCRINAFFNLSHNLTPIIGNNQPSRCKKCATKRNAIKGQVKSKETCKERYGVEHTFQVKEFQDKSKETLIEKYGEDYSKILAAKAKETYFKRTGYYHNGDDPKIRKKMIQGWKSTVSNMSIEDKREWHSKRMAAYLKPNSPGIFGGIGTNTQSKISKDFFTKLQVLYEGEHEIQYGNNEKQVLNYFVDGYIEGVCIIEFYGDFWHANPKIYNEKSVLNFPGKNQFTAKQIWHKDNDRLKQIVNKEGIPVIIIWESDYKKHLSQIIQKIFTQITKIKERKNNEAIITIY
jgi:hypothetical protein